MVASLKIDLFHYIFFWGGGICQKPKSLWYIVYLIAWCNDFCVTIVASLGVLQKKKDKMVHSSNILHFSWYDSVLHFFYETPQKKKTERHNPIATGKKNQKVQKFNVHFWKPIKIIRFQTNTAWRYLCSLFKATEVDCLSSVPSPPFFQASYSTGNFTSAIPLM